MSIIWSGLTEEGVIVPVQVTAEGKVVAVGDGPEGDYLKLTGGNLTGDLTVNEQIKLATDGSSTFGGGNFELLADGKLTVNRASAATVADFGTAGFSNYIFTSNAFDNPYSNAGLHIGTNLENIPSDDNIFLGVDGHATFGGTVRSNNTGSNSCFQAGTSSVVNTSIRADGSAVFSGNITAGNVSFILEDGQTLDVKDSIRRLQSALYRLKAAVLIPDATVNDLRLRILEALETISEEENS